MNTELRTKLDEYAKSKDWAEEDGTVSDRTIRDVLVDASPIKEYGHNEHRWFTMYSVVVQIGEFFVDFQTYSNSGDKPAFDKKEWDEMVLQDAIEVFPKEVTVTDYVTADKK